MIPSMMPANINVGSGIVCVQVALNPCLLHILRQDTTLAAAAQVMHMYLYMYHHPVAVAALVAAVAIGQVPIIGINNPHNFIPRGIAFLTAQAIIRR